MTGKTWQEFTLREILLELRARKDLLIASHWWCPQELCLYLYPDSYTRIFKQDSTEDLAWWLGENGIQASSESLSKMTPMIDSASTPSISESGNTPLGELDTTDTSTRKILESCVDTETYCLIQEIYETDAKLYGKAV